MEAVRFVLRYREVGSASGRVEGCLRFLISSGHGKGREVINLSVGQLLTGYVMDVSLLPSVVVL